MPSMPTFNLPEWQPVDFALLESSKKKIEVILEKTGKGSDKFNKAYEKFKAILRNGKSSDIQRFVKTAVDVRALTYLMGRQEFHRYAILTQDMLDSLYNPRPNLGLISLLQLIYAFFQYFDQIGGEKAQNKKVFESICSLLSREVEDRAGGNAGPEITKLAQNRNLLFTLDGPQRVVNFATRLKVDLDVAFKELSLQNYHDTRFHRLCRYRYYLDTLKRLPIGKDDPVLKEVCKHEVYDAPASDGRLLGHEVLSILIDRADRLDISDAWRGVILTIAGDPRVPNTSTRFLKWWSILGAERQRKVRGWLSGFDLMLFLKALENYGRVSGNTDLQRMFKARKIFLEGLHAQGLVTHSRLFVGSSPERYLQSKYKKEELPEYAKVKDSHRSMIYLQVGNCHMIEGSHSFKLWLFPKLPSNAAIVDYSKQIFYPKHLSYIIESKYQMEFGNNSKQPLAITHYPDLAWQEKAIKYLKSEGIHLDIEQLINPQNYPTYINRYGF